MISCPECGAPIEEVNLDLGLVHCASCGHTQEVAAPEDPPGDEGASDPSVDAFRRHARDAPPVVKPTTTMFQRWIGWAMVSLVLTAGARLCRSEPAPPPPSAVDELTPMGECTRICTETAERGELWKGLSIEACAAQLCEQ